MSKFIYQLNAWVALLFSFSVIWPFPLEVDALKISLLS